MPDAAGYNVYRSADGSPAELLATDYQSDFAAYADRIAPGVAYTYFVEWVDTGGNVSPASNVVTATATTRTRRR